MNYNISYHSSDGYKKLRSIDEIEFKELKIKREFVLFYYNFEQLFNLFKLNTYEFWNYYFEVSEKSRLKIISSSNDLENYSVNFNIKLANILSAFRLYIDQVPVRLKGRETQGVRPLDTFTNGKINAYEKYFCYRFFTN